MPFELAPEQLRLVCDPKELGFSTTAELAPAPAIIGQDRAIRSLDFGLTIKEQGFHIYVAGVPGTGRTSAVRSFLEEMAKGKPVPSDWCYVNNFEDSYKPKALRLPPGLGRRLERDVKGLVDHARREIPKAFESEQYAAKREETIGRFNKLREQLFTQLSQTAAAQGLGLQATPVGLVIIPAIQGRPMTDQEFVGLNPEVREEIGRRREVLEGELRNMMRQLRSSEKDTSEEIAKLDREVAIFSIAHVVQELMDDYKEFPEVIKYVGAVQSDMLGNLSQFREEPAEAAKQMPIAALWSKDMAFRKYQVNVVVDNSTNGGSPVVIELNPTYANLFGRIEKEAQFGAFLTDFTLIRAGSLHKANGGYVVIPVEEILKNVFSWDSLKRAIRNGEIAIEDPAERLGFVATKILMPDPIPLNVKILLIGNPYLYHTLYAYDEDFKELFKVKADFDTRMERSQENLRAYAGSICIVCQKEGLHPFGASAMAKVIEYSSRLAEDQGKLSTRFSEISDILREASYWAVKAGAEIVEPSHVAQAIEERICRSNLVQERVNELIAQGTIIIDTTAEEVGQVNGLSVISLGDYSFGRPSRITATVAVGREGVMDIERETKLGGPIHTKGVMILGGVLADRYAQDKPLTLSARLTFEQSYEGVEGDSASSAELYALLSRLSGVPVKQYIAVTGSVNQKGDVQAIGGVNEKIEGFFSVCKAKGLNGQQGVMIPASNVRHLMLKEEVVEAVREGTFHVWAVRSIDEGIEVLTGFPAGPRKPDGGFEEGKVNYLVDQRLREFARQFREFQKDDTKVPQEPK